MDDNSDLSNSELNVNKKKEKRIRRQNYEWDEEKSIELINYVHSFKHLWNSNDENYKNRGLHCRSWETISQILNMPKSEVVIRWSSMRSNYRGYKKKLTATKNEKEYNKARKCNPIFKEMQFLDDVIKSDCTFHESDTNNSSSKELMTQDDRGIERGIRRKSERVIERKSEREIERGIERRSERGIERGNKRGNEKGSERRSERGIEREMEIVRRTERNIPMLSHVRENQKVDQEYDDDILAKAWVVKLKRLTPMQKILAEKAINDILFEAELGTLNRNSVKINDCDNTTMPLSLSEVETQYSPDETSWWTITSPSVIIKNEALVDE